MNLTPITESHILWTTQPDARQLGALLTWSITSEAWQLQMRHSLKKAVESTWPILHFIPLDVSGSRVVDTDSPGGTGSSQAEAVNPDLGPLMTVGEEAPGGFYDRGSAVAQTFLQLSVGPHCRASNCRCTNAGTRRWSMLPPFKMKSS